MLARGTPYSEYEFLARQSAELPAYWDLKQLERNGTLRERTVASVADLAIILDQTEEICADNESAQDPDPPPRRPRSKAARRQQQADKLEPFEPYDDATDPQFERLGALFDEYDVSIKWAACQNDQFRRLTDRDAERGSLYAPFVTQSTIPGVGMGLFAGANLPVKSFVARYEGELVPTAVVHTPEYKSAYAFKISDAWSVDARANPWTPGRYANHVPAKDQNVRFSVHSATKGVKLVTTKGVPRGTELFLHYGDKFFDSQHQPPESDANTVSLRGHFVDYYGQRSAVTEEQQELRDEADRNEAGWATLPTPEASPQPPPAKPPASAPAPAPPAGTEWRYWTARPTPSAQFLAAALAQSRQRSAAPVPVCDLESWESVAMRRIDTTPATMPLMYWADNSCFADALVMAMFAQSYAFDPVLSVPGNAENPSERAAEALKRPLRRLINAMRTPGSAPFLADNFIGELRIEFQFQLDLPLPIRRTYGRGTDNCSMGAPEQLLAALIDRPPLAPLSDTVLPVPWALLPEVRRGPVIDRYPSMKVDLERVPGTLAEAVVAKWTDAGRAQLLSAPHAFVVHYMRTAYRGAAFPVVRQLRIGGQQYLLRSAVAFRGQAHFVAFVRDHQKDEWYLLDPLKRSAPRSKLTPRQVSGALDGTASFEDIDLRLDATLLLYESSDFAALSSLPAPPAVPGDATLGALFGSGVERVVRQAREMYRSARLRSSPPRPMLRPPRDYLPDADRGLVPPFRASRGLSSPELLLLAVATAGEAWDYALGSAPGVIRRMEQNAGSIEEGSPNSADREASDLWYKRQLFLLTNRASRWDESVDSFDAIPAAFRALDHIGLRDRVLGEVFDPPRAGNRYPGQPPSPASAPVEQLSPATREAMLGFIGRTREEAERRLAGVERDGPFWLPRECTLRGSRDSDSRLLVVFREATSESIEQALESQNIANLPAVFVARFELGDAGKIAPSVSLRLDRARCYDLAGLAPTYTLVAVLFEHRYDEPALVHRQCGLSGYWVRRPSGPPVYAADLAEALGGIAPLDFVPKTLVYQNSAFDAPPAFY